MAVIVLSSLAFENPLGPAVGSMGPLSAYTLYSLSTLSTPNLTDWRVKRELVNNTASWPHYGRTEERFPEGSGNV